MFTEENVHWERFLGNNTLLDDFIIHPDLYIYIYIYIYIYPLVVLMSSVIENFLAKPINQNRSYQSSLLNQFCTWKNEMLPFLLTRRELGMSSWSPLILDNLQLLVVGRNFFWTINWNSVMFVFLSWSNAKKFHSEFIFIVSERNRALPALKVTYILTIISC